MVTNLEHLTVRELCLFSQEEQVMGDLIPCLQVFSDIV